MSHTDTPSCEWHNVDTPNAIYHRKQHQSSGRRSYDVNLSIRSIEASLSARVRRRKTRWKRRHSSLSLPATDFIQLLLLSVTIMWLPRDRPSRYRTWRHCSHVTYTERRRNHVVSTRGLRCLPCRHTRWRNASLTRREFGACRVRARTASGRRGTNSSVTRRRPLSGLDPTTRRRRRPTLCRVSGTTDVPPGRQWRRRRQQRRGCSVQPHHNIRNHVISASVITTMHRSSFTRRPTRHRPTVPHRRRRTSAELVLPRADRASVPPRCLSAPRTTLPRRVDLQPVAAVASRTRRGHRVQGRSSSERVCGSALLRRLTYDPRLERRALRRSTATIVSYTYSSGILATGGQGKGNYPSPDFNLSKFFLWPFSSKSTTFRADIFYYGEF